MTASWAGRRADDSWPVPVLPADATTVSSGL
ncbi:hypothetical protein Aros01_07572 [Streptosporangium roseum]